MRRVFGWIVALFVTFAAAGPVLGQNSDAAWEAYNRGDYARAYAEWLPRANAGEAYAQYNLGVLYKRGEGVTQDFAQAAAWYRRAADQGDASAQNSLGLLYEDGEGVAQDYAQAASWYRRAADQADADAQYNLGVLYMDGTGVPKDLVEAFVLLDRSAALYEVANDAEYLADAVKYRDQVYAAMTPDQRAAATARRANP
jgi:TPR repeat protein